MANIPKTIQELQEFCDSKGMPLEKMRFFIGKDFREPCAFGIYKDGSWYVVYKNKDNGSRAVRYHGPDEAYAVKEIYLKLLDECHNRGIYPDRDVTGTEESTESVTKSGIRQEDIVYTPESRAYPPRSGITRFIIFIVIFALLGLGLWKFVFVPRMESVDAVTSPAEVIRNTEDVKTSTDETIPTNNDDADLTTILILAEPILNSTLDTTNQNTSTQDITSYSDNWSSNDDYVDTSWSDTPSYDSSNSWSSSYDSWDYSSTDWSSDW